MDTELPATFSEEEIGEREMLLIKIPFSITTKDMLNAEKIVKLY